MTRREQIILALMGVSILIGGYMYFSDPGTSPRTTATMSMADVEALTKDVTAVLGKKGLSGNEEYLVGAIGRQWTSDPFVELGAEETTQVVREEVRPETVQFDYTAYVLVGDRFVGVINGREYQAGDTLAQDGYSLLRLDTRSALIKGPGEKNMIVVPYREFLVSP
ncbi:hypothetical protein [Desulfoplanes sp.]